MTHTEPPRISDAPLSKLLKAATSHAHDLLDNEIMAARPFASLQRYRRFLCMQYVLHRDACGLYEDAALQALIPPLATLARLPAIIGDMADLGVLTPGVPAAGTASVPPDTAEGLGWLYVLEGSNLGAAFLYKAALKLGLSDSHGARHLAASPDGRAAQWRRFTACLDTAELDGSARERATAGAEAAFSHARSLAARFLGQ